MSTTPFPLAPGDLAGDRKGLCGTGLFQGQRPLSFQIASALRELLLCGCDDIVLRCPLCVNWEEFPTATNIFSLWLRLCKWKWLHFFVKVNISTMKLPYWTMCDFPVLPSAEDGLNLVDNGEEMGGLSLVLCILQCAPWPWQKAVTHQSTLCRKSLLVFFGPSPSCNSRLKKIMQVCSCLDHSSKENESSSAKTFSFYHWVPKDPAKAFLYIGTSDHTPSVKFTTSFQLLRPGCNLGALEQCDRVTPWALALNGPWVSDLSLLKSHSVSQSHTSWAPRTSESHQRQVTHC